MFWVYRFAQNYQEILIFLETKTQNQFLKLFTIFFYETWQECNFIIFSSFISMLFSAFCTRKKNSDFRVLHLIGDRIHFSLAFSRSISRDISIYMERSETKRAVITAGFRSLGNLLSAVMACKVFVNRFHRIWIIYKTISYMHFLNELQPSYKNHSNC